MNIYLLSCAAMKDGGGVYRYKLSGNGTEREGFLPCDRPMYAVNDGKRLHILLRAPFPDSENSGYFSCNEDFTDCGEIKDTLGKCACHLAVAKNDVYIANYLSGNIVKNCTLPRVHTGGGVCLLRQDMPHTHFAAVSRDKKRVLCCDLGLDTVFVYDRDLNEVSRAKVPAGYGVRHLAITQDGHTVYAVNELVPSVSVFSFDGENLGLKRTVTLPCENKTSTAAAIRLSADETKLYVSARGENALFVLRAEGERTEIIQKASCGGDSPRDFNLFGNLILCCNERSDNIHLFETKNGFIKNKVNSITLKSPLCVL